MPVTYTHHVVPYRGFIKELKQLDSRLGVKFRYDIERFVITWDMPVGPSHELFVVRDERGGFRQPDKRDLLFLCANDLHRTDLRSHLSKTERLIQEFRERQERYEEDEVKGMTADGKIQLMNAYRETFNTGGKPSAHRRIGLNPRGLTLDQMDKLIKRNETEQTI